jgi:serine/threonine-protein kinase
MATGRRPFVGSNTAQLISSVLRDQPAPISGIRKDLPPALISLVDRCLEKERAERCATAVELLESLKLARAAVKQSADPGARNSIAVLPFTNLSGDPGEEFFSDGVSEEIINALSTIGGLRVAARTSAFSFKGLAVDVSEIASKLNVQKVLEGSVRKAGNRIRITAQLIDASDGCQVWSERFDRELIDIFAVQDEIATAIARKFEGTERTSQDGPLVKTPTRNSEAYEFYLRGLHCWGLGLRLKEARDCFDRAVQLDPQFAAAWAGLADAYSTLAFNTQRRPLDVMPKAKEAAERALALDDTLPEAHSAVAYWHLVYDWNWAAAEAGFKRTLELKANDARTMHHYGHLYHAFVSHDLDAGLELCARSVDVDPLATYSRHGLYANLVVMGRYDEAIAGLLPELERAPLEAHLRRLIGQCYLEKSMFDEAREAIGEAVRTSGRHPWATFELGMFHARTGNPDAAEAVQAELQARGRPALRRAPPSPQPAEPTRLTQLRSVGLSRTEFK